MDVRLVALGLVAGCIEPVSEDPIHFTDLDPYDLLESHDLAWRPLDGVAFTFVATALAGSAVLCGAPVVAPVDERTLSYTSDCAEPELQPLYFSGVMLAAEDDLGIEFTFDHFGWVSQAGGVAIDQFILDGTLRVEPGLEGSGRVTTPELDTKVVLAGTKDLSAHFVDFTFDGVYEATGAVDAEAGTVELDVRVPVAPAVLEGTVTASRQGSYDFVYDVAGEACDQEYGREFASGEVRLNASDEAILRHGSCDECLEWETNAGGDSVCWKGGEPQGG